MRKLGIKSTKLDSNTTINSIVYWMKSMVVASVLAFITLSIVGLIAVRSFNDQRERDRTQDAEQLQARLIESCLNYNRDKTDDRLAAHAKIIALARLAGRDPDILVNDPEFKVRFDAFDVEMASLYAYRKCDPVCAVSYVNKDIPDCPPSDNEEGT